MQNDALDLYLRLGEKVRLGLLTLEQMSAILDGEVTYPEDRNRASAEGEQEGLTGTVVVPPFQTLGELVREVNAVVHFSHPIFLDSKDPIVSGTYDFRIHCFGYKVRTRAIYAFFEEQGHEGSTEAMLAWYMQFRPSFEDIATIQSPKNTYPGPQGRSGVRRVPIIRKRKTSCEFTLRETVAPWAKSFYYIAFKRRV